MRALGATPKVTVYRQNHRKRCKAHEARPNVWRIVLREMSDWRRYLGGTA